MSLEHSNLRDEFIIEFLSSGEETLLKKLVSFGALNSRHIGVYPCLEVQWIVEAEISKFESVLCLIV